MFADGLAIVSLFTLQDIITSKIVDMKKITYCIIILLPIVTNAQKNYTQLLDQYLLAQMKVNGFSGSVLVIKQNKIKYSLKKDTAMLTENGIFPTHRKPNFASALSPNNLPRLVFCN